MSDFDLNKSLGFIKQIGSTGDTELRQSMIEGMKTDPDQAARALPFAEKNRIPLDMAQRNLSELEQDEKFNQINFSDMQYKYPLLANFLRDKENAALAHDDVGALTRIGDFGRSIGSGVSHSIGAVFSGAGRGMQRISSYAAEGQVKKQSLGYGNAVDDFLGATAIGTTALVGEGLEFSGEAWKTLAEGIRPPEERRNLGTDIGEGLGQVTTQIGAAIMSAPATLPIMIAQGLDYGFDAAEEAGAYGTPKGDVTAMLYAGITGLTEKYGLEFLMKGIPEPVKRGVLGWLSKAATSAGLKADGAIVNATMKTADTAFRGLTEASQEFTEGFLQNLVDIELLDQDKPLLEGLDRQAAAGGGVGTIVGAIINTMIRGRTSFDIERERIIADEMKQAREIVGGSKLFGRARHKVNEYLNAEIGNKDLYLNPEAVQTFYQSMPSDQKAMLNQQIPDFESKLDEAIKTNGDMVLNRADYFTYVQPMDEQAMLDNYVRYTPEDMSVADRQGYDDMMKSMLEDMDKQAKGVESGDLVQEYIYGQLAKKLGERGASGSPDVARLISQNPRKFYETVAERSNYDPRVMDILNRLVRDVRIVRVNPKIREMAKRDDFDLFIDKARSRVRSRRQSQEKAAKNPKKNLFGETLKKKQPVFSGPKPMIDFLISRGQIRTGSPAAKDLEPLDLNPKRYPKLFARDGVVTAFDNIPIEEMMPEIGDVLMPKDDGNGYADPDWIIDTIRAEMIGKGSMSEDQMNTQAMEDELESLIQNTDYMGLDLESASNQEVRDALAAYEKQYLEDMYGPQDQAELMDMFGPAQAKDNTVEIDGQTVDVAPEIMAKAEAIEQEEQAAPEFNPEEKPAPIEQQVAEEKWADAVAAQEQLDKPVADMPQPEPETGEKAEQQITDFGEKLEGARKDLWKEYQKAMSGELPVDAAEITLSKHFPEPDYEFLISQGADPRALAAVKAMRDTIPNKPRDKYKLARWAEQLKTLREFSNNLVSGQYTVDEILNKMRTGNYRLAGLVNDIVLYGELGYPAFVRAKGYGITFAEFSVYQGVRYEKPRALFSVNNNYRTIEAFETRQEAVDFLRAKLSIEPEKKQKQTKLDIYQVTKTGEIIIGKKVGSGKFIDLKGGFKTAREARLYLSDNLDALLVLLEKKKEVPPERRSTNDPRRGQDYRLGEQVSPERFASEFGFRGVQFGNYVEQRKRSSDLNNAYDAFLDMANILGVPSRAVSLNGSLGLAFGARGKGGKNAPLAHYEGDHVVINLTKTGGPGSLAHEWWHALDNFFGKQRKGNVFLTEQPTQPKLKQDGTPVTDFPIRPEVVQAFYDVMNAINKTGMLKRSEKLDKSRSKDYWSTNLELSARAFEAYIIHKASQKNESNDYLANIVGKGFFDAETGADESTSTYPYPTDDEMASIAPAFDKLFQTLKTKETEKGVTFYQSAFHGSPHRFDKFTLDRIGSGEGNQAFGWGLYFAGKREVAEWYKDAGIEISPRLRIVWENHNYDRNKTKAALQQAIDENANGGKDVWKPVLDELNSIPEGQLYEVSLPEDDQLLHWDKPIEKQPPVVKQALKDAGLWKELKDNLSDFSSPQNTRGKLKGENIYAFLQWKLGSDKAASLRLNELGISGMKYPAGTIANTKGGGYNYVIFDDSAIETLRTFYQSGEGQTPRGAISFQPDGTALIRLFQDEDLSTVMHEMGHLYWKALTEIASLDNAPTQIKQDVVTMRQWVGADPVNISTPLTVDQEEKIADGFLSYLREGEAPTADLQGAFSRMKFWMTRLYRGVRDSLPKITPEVKGVFDRMLATDLEISRISQKPEFAIDEAIINMLPKAEAERYRKKVQRAIEEAKAKLLKKALYEAERRLSSEYREAQAQAKKDATAQVNAEQVYQAIDQILKSGGLDRESLLKEYGQEILKYMTPHGAGMVTKKGAKGIRAADIANLTGYGYGSRNMIGAIMNAPKKADRIKTVTESLLLERYGDMLQDGTIEEQAMQTYHNNVRAEVLAIEYKMLKDLSGIAGPTPEAIKSKAIQMISDKSVSDIRPERFLRSENSSYFQYGKSLGQKNYAKAAKHKAQQLLNHHLYRTAIDADEAISKRLEQYRRLITRKDEKIGKALDIDYVYAARSILAKYGIGKEGFSFEPWIRQLTAENPDLAEALQMAIAMNTEAVPAWSQTTNRRGVTTNIPPYKRMSFGDFQALGDAVDNLLETGRNQRNITIEGKRVEVGQAVQELVSGMAGRKAANISTGYGGKLTDQDKLSLKFYNVKAWLRRVNHWVRDMDGGKYSGPFRTYIWQPVSDAVGRYKDQRQTEMKTVLETLAPIREELFSSGPIAAPELRSSKTGEIYIFENLGEVIGMMAHTGNQSNKFKLVAGYGWGDVDENGNVDTSALDQFLRRLESDGTIKKEHWETVQKMWDQMEALKPAVWKAHKDMYGFRPEEVTAEPVQTAYGQFRGGYWPAIVDKTKNDDAAKREIVNQITNENNQYAFPSTGRGATKSRVENYAAPLEFNIRQLPSHVDWAVRFIHIEPAIKDAMKIMMNKEFIESMKAIDPAAIPEMLVPWLSRVGRQATDLPMTGSKTWRDLNKVAGYVRRQSGLMMMMGNVVNIFQQVTGIAPLMRKTGIRNFGRAFLSYSRNPNEATRNIHGLSAVMRHQHTMFDEDYQRRIQRILDKRNKMQKVQDFSEDYGYIGQRVFQHYINNVGWMSAYQQAMEGRAEGINPDDQQAAVRYADEVVSETQGFSSPEYLSNAEVQTQMGKLFLLFYSYFNNQGNMLVNEGKNILRSDKPIAGKAASAFYLYLMCYMIPSFVADLIGAVMRGAVPDDDDDDGTALDEWFQYFLISQARYPVAMVPYMREVGSYVIGKFTDAPFDDRLTGSPALSIIERTLSAPFSVIDAVFDDGDESKAMKDTLTALGMVGLPTGFIVRPATYAADVAEGDSDIPDRQPAAGLEVMRGVLAGPAVSGGNSGGK